MTGVIFIVTVPKKKYEIELKSNKINTEKQCETTFKLINELKEKQMNKSLKCTHKNENIMIKCKSADSLHSNPDICFHGTKSEIILTERYMEDTKNYENMWEDVKQVIKPRKNKLIVNKPVRGVNILDAFHWDTPLETVLSEVISRLDIRNVTWNSTKDEKFWQVIFSLESGNLSEELLQVLRTFGIGSEHQSTVSLVPCALFYKDNRSTSIIDGSKHARENDADTTWFRFSSSVRARTNLAQVLHGVRSDATLTFDWVFMLLVAALVAAIGLIEDSTAILVASMLISPLMGPLTAGTLGTVVRDRSLQMMGVMNEFLGLFLCLAIGFIFGLVISIVDENYKVVDDWPTHEMIARCEFRSLCVGILVAIPTGAGAAIAVLGGYTSSLVGVAISAALLPPAVNAGLLWAMAFIRFILATRRREASNSPIDLAVLGTVSLCLTLVNIACIFLSGLTVYKVKKVCALEQCDIPWWRANKNRLQETEESFQKKTSLSLNRDIYNKWCSGTLQRKQEAENNEVPPTHVDSNTVTYRRRPSTTARYRTNNCLRCEGNYSTLNKDKIDGISTITDETLDTNNIQENETDSTEDVKKHNYYNNGYNDKLVQKHIHPTIEPSLCFTVDPKMRTFLGNKVIDV